MEIGAKLLVLYGYNPGEIKYYQEELKKALEYQRDYEKLELERIDGLSTNRQMKVRIREGKTVAEGIHKKPGSVSTSRENLRNEIVNQKYRKHMHFDKSKKVMELDDKIKDLDDER